MNRVVHFEIHSADPEKLAEFYRNVFNWEIKEWVVPGVKMSDENRYWMVMTAPEGSMEPGINGGILFRRGTLPKEGDPVNAYICTVGVASVDEFTKKIIKAGGIIKAPKMAVSGVGWIAYAKDIDDNVFGIYEKNEKVS